MQSTLALAAAALLLPVTGFAQAPPGVARGVSVAIDSDTLTLKSGDGT